MELLGLVINTLILLHLGIIISIVFMMLGIIHPIGLFT